MDQIMDVLAPSRSAPPREFNSGTMKVAGDVIEFKTSDGKISRVYRVSNISAVVLIEREIPWLLILLACLSLLVSITVTFLALVGIPAFIVILVFLIRFYMSTDSYTLAILLNAGHNASTYVGSFDVDFLRRMAEVIRDLMNGNAQGHKYFISIDKHKINQINVHGDVSGGALSSGDNNDIGLDEEDEETQFDETGSDDA